MSDSELVLRKGDGQSVRYEITECGLTIGRHPDCDVILTDGLVSRRHARVWRDAAQILVEDFGSRNGITVNGHKVERGPLHEGDILRVGEATFQVTLSSTSRLGDAVISHANAAALYESMVKEGSGDRLSVLYEAAQLLGSVFDLDELLHKILTLIFKALPVRRGYIVTISEESGEPEIHAQLSKEEGEDGPPVSHTLIRHVLEHRDAMLTVDAQMDSRFDATKSIVDHDIHAAMCAPLCGRESIVGAIYVDSGTQSKPFGKPDLEMLSAIALVVGVGVENARLYRESVRQERLAAIGEATAGLGHCMKNILTGIRGGAEFLNMAVEKGDVSYLTRGWPIMARAIDRIDMLVQNLMAFSKDRELERVQTNVNDLINDVLGILRTRAERANVTLAFNPGELNYALIDGQQIYRVFLNLIVNAIEATEQSGGTVTVECLSDADGCTIRVSDDGVGIPAEALPNLFQLFVSSKGSSGTGLGLACSYKIVHAHGGDIDVESEPGQGAVFTVFLPSDETPGSPGMFTLSDGPIMKKTKPPKT